MKMNILFSLLLKEWLKLRRYFIAALVLNFTICIKIFFDIRQQMRAEHSEMVWYQAIHLHSILYEDIQYLPLITGLILAAAQFIPEMLGERLRISLHLPIKRNVMLFYSILCGLLLYLTVCVMNLLLIKMTLQVYFPMEVAATVLTTMLPWILAGLIAYLGSITVLLEPAWPRKIFILLIFAVLATMLFSGIGYSWFIPALGWLILIAPLSLFTIFESGRRFQEEGGS